MHLMKDIVASAVSCTYDTRALLLRKKLFHGFFRLGTKTIGHDRSRRGGIILVERREKVVSNQVYLIGSQVASSCRWAWSSNIVEGLGKLQTVVWVVLGIWNVTVVQWRNARRRDPLEMVNLCQLLVQTLLWMNVSELTSHHGKDGSLGLEDTGDGHQLVRDGKHRVCVA